MYFCIGIMFAGVAWIQSVGILVGQATQNAIMAATSRFMNGIVFFVDAGIFALSALLAL